MFKSLFFIASIVLFSTHAFANNQDCQVFFRDWPRYFQNPNQYEKGKALCKELVSKQKSELKATGHMCYWNYYNVVTEKSSNHDSSTHSILKKENAQNALVHLNQAIDLYPQKLCLHLTRQDLLGKAKFFELFPQHLSKTLSVYKKRKSNELKYWLNYAVSLYKEKQFQSSLDYHKIIDQNYPNNPQVLDNIVSLALDLNKIDEAKTYLDKVENLDSKGFDYLWNWGRYYQIKKDYIKAESYYKKALNHYSKDSKKLIQHKTCSYAKFLEKHFKNRKQESKKLQKENCLLMVDG